MTNLPPVNTAGHILLGRSKSNAADVQLYIVVAAPAALATLIAQIAPRDEFDLDQKVQPASAELVGLMGLKPGKVRKF